MKLRTTIRAPTRFGEEMEDPLDSELYHAIRAARGESGAQSMSGSSSLPVTFAATIRRSTPEHPSSDPYDDTLPPAAFPSLPFGLKSDRLPVEKNGSALKSPDKEKLEIDAEEPWERLTLAQVENLAASNNEYNPVYVKNMEIMRAPPENYDIQMFEDSDLDEPMDASAELGAKIVNPTWKDIHPALQVEIVGNIRTLPNWRKHIQKLELTEEDKQKFKSYAKTWSQQVRRENNTMEKMRENQLKHLLSFDHSDIRVHNVPRQLVLRRDMRVTCKTLLKHIAEADELLMCQTSDVLAARHFLGQRNLPKSFAGSWGHDMVELQEPEEDKGTAPEMFAWKEDLTEKCKIERAQLSSRNRQPDILSTIHETAWSQTLERRKGPGGKEFVNPRDLTLRGNEVNRRIYDPVKSITGQPTITPHTSSSAFTMLKTRHDTESTNNFEAPKRDRSNGAVRLDVGPDTAARIQQPFKESRVPLQPLPYIHPLAANEVAMLKRQIQTIPSILDETPTRVPGTARLFADSPHGLSPLKFPDLALAAKGAALPVRPASPVTRILASPWNLFAMDHTIAQRRFEAGIEKARIQAMQTHERDLARRVQEEKCAGLFHKLPPQTTRARPMLINLPQKLPQKLPKDVLTRDQRLPVLDDFFTEHWRAFPRLTTSVDRDCVDDTWMREWVESDVEAGHATSSPETMEAKVKEMEIESGQGNRVEENTEEKEGGI